jgi:hypothetical protein
MYSGNPLVPWRASVEITTLLAKLARALAAVYCFTFMLSEPVSAQQVQSKPAQNNVRDEEKDSTELKEFSKQDVLTSLRLLADEIKDEDDRAAAVVAQARIADTIWEFDEQAARTIFRRAFETALRPAGEADSGGRSAKTVAMRRQAFALKEVLRRFGARDRKEAEKWLRQIEKEQESDPHSARQPSSGRAEILGQIALELSATDPQRSLELGLHSLSGNELPSVFGRLLFTLSRGKDRTLSNTLFVAAIATMRRGGYVFDPAINALSNYLFDSRGKLFLAEDAANAKLLIKYFVDAARFHTALQKELPPGRGEASDSTAQLFTFLNARALPVVALNASADLPQMQALLRELASGLSQQQLKNATTVASSVQRPASSLDQRSSDIESRIRHAENERNAAARDNLWRGIAIDLTGGESDRALQIAAKIGDEFTRRLTEDDIRLAVVSDKIKGQAYGEARAVAAKFNDDILKSKVLAQLADRILSDSKNKDTGLADELLSQAHSLVQKVDNTPDKVQVLLILAAKFAKFDSGRGFELLYSAVKVANELPSTTTGDISPTFSNRKPSGLLVVRYLMVGGKEFTTGERATIDSIEFSEAGDFAKLNYTQTKLMGEAVRNKFLKTKFLIAIADELLRSSPQRATSPT